MAMSVLHTAAWDMLPAGLTSGIVAVLSPPEDELRSIATTAMRQLTRHLVGRVVFGLGGCFVCKAAVRVGAKLLPGVRDFLMRVYPDKLARLSDFADAVPTKVLKGSASVINQQVVALLAARVLHWLGNPLVNGAPTARTYYELWAVLASTSEHLEGELFNALPPSCRWLRVLQFGHYYSEERVYELLRSATLTQYICSEIFGTFVKIFCGQAKLTYLNYRGLLTEPLGAAAFWKHIEHVTGLLSSVFFAIAGDIAERLQLQWYHMLPGLGLLCTEIGFLQTCITVPAALLFARGGTRCCIASTGGLGMSLLITERVGQLRAVEPEPAGGHSEADLIEFFGRQDTADLEAFQARLTMQLQQAPSAADDEAMDRGQAQLVLQHLLHYREQLALGNISRGLSERTLNKFSQRLQYRKRRDSQLRGEEGDVVCVFCQADIEDGDSIRKLPCGHSYHVACIDRWMKRSKLCPMCRQDPTKVG